VDTEYAAATEPTETKPAKAKPKPRAEDMTPTERANLALFLTDDEAKPVGLKVVRRWLQDVSSREDRMKKLDQLQKMYALVAETKSFPWHKCANIKTPSLTGPNLQIQARLYDMIWPANGKVFNVVPSTHDDQVLTHLTERFANAYVRHRMAYMAQGLDDTLHQMTLYGSAFRRTYWDAYERKVRSDWIPIEDFVVAASTRSQDPSMSDVPRYTMVHHMSRYDIEERGLDGIFVNTELVKGQPEGTNSQFKDTADKLDGQTMDADDEDMPRKVLEQHCKWRLPNRPKEHPAFDGREHHVIITVDKESQAVLRMCLREEDDPDDKRRYDREFAAYEEYGRQLQKYHEQQAGLTVSQPPVPGAPDMTAPPEMGGPPDMSMGGMEPVMDAQAPAAPMGDPMAMQAPPPPLEEPAPVDPPTPVRRRQICFFTHYRCFPSDGFYGLGYGDLLLGIAIAQNTVINQWVDGQAVKNARPMFMSRQIRMARGAVNIGPGEVNEVDGPVGSLKEAIMFLDPPGSDPGTVPLIKMLDGFTDRIAGNGDLMSGQAPGSNQTKAGMQILNDQMMAPITVLARRVKDAFRHELDKIWRCWGVFLGEDEAADFSGKDEPKIERGMFSPSAHLVPTADPRMKSQRMEDFQNLFGFCMSSPFLQSNPQIGMPLMGKLTEMGLRLFPDGEPLIPMLTPPPPPPPQPKDQTEENAEFLEGKASPVLPQDNDDEHLFKLAQFKTTPEFAALDPKGQQAAMQHERNHMAQRMKKGIPFGGQGPGSGGPGGFGSPGMAMPPGLAPPPGAPPA
jgi:hypothetical protein